MADQQQHQQQQQQQQHQQQPSPIIMRIFGHHWNDCGYCRGKRAALVERQPEACSKAFHILINQQLQPAQYEEFINHGWRRCGAAIYKPDNWESCCPQISIRLPVQRFTPSKSQRKVLKKMQVALRKPATTTTTSNNSDKKNKQNQKADRKDVNKSLPADFYHNLVQKVQTILLDILKQQSQSPLVDDLDSLLARKITFKPRPQLNHNKQTTNDVDNERTVIVVSTAICAAVSGKSKGQLDKSQLCTQVAQALRRVLLQGRIEDHQDATRKKRSRDDTNGGSDAVVVSVVKVEPHVKSGQILVHCLRLDAQHDTTTQAMMMMMTNETMPMEQDSTTTTTTTDRLALWWERQKLSQPLAEERKLAITTLPAHESALDPNVYRLYALYQHRVHGDADPFQEDLSSSSSSSGEHDQNGTSTTTTTTTSSSPWNGQWCKRAPRGWMEKLQRILENEFRHVTLERRNHVIQHYIQFYEFLVDNSYPLENTQQGTFHQHYRINGVLIAVGIVDVLPQGLSSVYVFYDPDFCHSVAPLGKFTVLREIQWAQEHGLPYYYLGYYIESCGKMRYKADYSPSDLLCPRTARWVPAAQAQRLIQEKSPERHCCAFVPESQISPFDSGNWRMSIPPHLKLEIGMGRTVAWQELPLEITSVLGPVVEDFCKEAGLSLASQAVMDFR